MTDITIVATTWLPPGQEQDRLNLFGKTVHSWVSYICFNDKVHLHIQDDGTTEEWFENLKRRTEYEWINRAENFEQGELSFGQQKRHGVGASLNSGLQQAFDRGDIVLHAVDDWQLMMPLDLNPWVNFMEDPKYDVGMVRFFAHPDIEGTFRHIPPHGWAVALQRHHYVFALRPCLWHKRFFDAMGYFKEDCSALDCEYDFNWRFTSRPAAVEGERIWLALPEIWRHTSVESLAAVVPA